MGASKLAPDEEWPLKFQAKKSQHSAGFGFQFCNLESIGFCGRLNVVRDKRNEGILLAVGKLTKALQQLAFVQ